MQQFHLINQSLDKNKHVQMLCFGRFGKIHYPKDPPESMMDITELSRFKNVLKGAFNSMFAPVTFYYKVRDFLQTEGYQLDDSYIEYMVDVEDKGTEDEMEEDPVMRCYIVFQSHRKCR